jgi:Radical SAM superfamily
MAFQVAVAPFRSASGRAVLAALRDGSTTVGLDERDTLSFDGAGRLIRAFWAGRSIRRSLDHRFIEKRRAGPYPWSADRRTLGPAESRALLATVARDLEAVAEALAGPHPGVAGAHAEALRLRLAEILRWTPEALEADAAAFGRLYRPVRVLPPDQYGAVVVQLTEGCSYNQCSFCQLYRDRPFRVKSPEELRHHLRAVRQYFGKGLATRRSVFLADANALVLPVQRILDALEAVADALSGVTPGRRGVYSFVDAFSGLPRAAADFQAMAARGLRRVYLGMETGCDELLRLLNKPATNAEALALTRALKEGGVQVGVIVMVGIGGERYAAAHLRETVAALGAMPLGPGDLIYLSPLEASPGSPYRQREREAGLRPLGDAEMAEQLVALRAGLRGRPGGHPVVAVYDVRDFLY